MFVNYGLISDWFTVQLLIPGTYDENGSEKIVDDVSQDDGRGAAVKTNVPD